MEESERQLSQISEEHQEMLDYKLKQGILSAAAKAIPKIKGNGRKKVMPWWDKKYKVAVGTEIGLLDMLKEHIIFNI